jgi:maltose alpha-D-glucosyltransferase/alpha-amylase
MEPAIKFPAPVGETVTEDALWFKDAIIYELHVKAFFDSNRDGIGDFRGLTEKLDYVQELGVNTLWLLPFYPSPFKDDGYDVADYHNVHTAYGTRADFRQFAREAHRRGLRIITELVVNHTSDQHPWFKAARRAPAGSAKRNYYVWSDDPNKYAGTRIIFTDTETSNWAWDKVAQSYYWHRFFSHQPDLNFDNPHVLRAIFKTMRFWLDMGVDGFRLDAIPYLCEREGTNNENLPETHAVIKKIRALIDAHYTDRLLLAEANQWPEDVAEYFGSGDSCHMAYHFPLMPRLFMSIAMENRHPVVEIMRQTPDIPANCQWAIFLRNHDELTLEMVTDRERDYMYQMFAADAQMRINVGIRRRLAPLMDNDRAKIELMSFLLMTMPGSPIVYYGDELGMGDNIYLGDRNGVRTPMQWSPDRNAGFSRADPQRLYLPPIMDPVYGYESINVEAQDRNPSSLLNWTRRLIGVRKGFKAFGRGTLSFLEPGNIKVLAYLREYAGESILCVANLSKYAQAVELDLARYEGRVPVEVIGKESFPPIGKLPYLLTMPGYGYYVFRLAADAPVPSWHEQKLPYYELPLLVLREGWGAIFTQPGSARDVRRLIANATHEKLRDEVLLPYLIKRRWFAAKGHPIKDLDFAEAGEWNTPEGSWYLTFLDVTLADGPPHRYFQPLATAWETRGYNPLDTLGQWCFAKIRLKDKMGVLYGAFGNADFCRALARAMGTKKEISFAHGKLRFSATSAYAQLADAMNEEVRHPMLEQSNTGLFFGKRLYLKGYRRLQAGTSPELEVGQFLTDVSPYPHTAPIAGALEYIDRKGVRTTLAVLQAYVENQGDVWTSTLEYLERLLVRKVVRKEPPPVIEAASGPQNLVAKAVRQEPAAQETEGGLHNLFVEQARILGTRVGELHRAFAHTSGDPAFDPEPVTAEDLARWKERVRTDAVETLDDIERRRASLAENLRSEIDQLLAARVALLDRIESVKVHVDGLVKTRYHGDLHLGQVLLAGNDFVIIDFEGEPARTIEERRAKHSPLRDVAGMLRSISYAAHATLVKVGSAHPDARPQLQETLRMVEQTTITAFLAGYRAATEGVASVPKSAAAMRALADLFLLEKALYELRYELGHRPDWVGIPIRGLLELAQPAE